MPGCFLGIKYGSYKITICRNCAAEGEKNGKLPKRKYAQYKTTNRIFCRGPLAAKTRRDASTPRKRRKGELFHESHLEGVADFPRFPHQSVENGETHEEIGKIAIPQRDDDPREFHALREFHEALNGVWMLRIAPSRGESDDFEGKSE